MQTNELLENLKLKVKAGEINTEQIREYVENESPATLKKQSQPKWNQSFLTLFCTVIATIIIFAGMVNFFFQIENKFTPLTRGGILLGVGFLLAFFGSFFLKKRPQVFTGAVLHFLGGMAIAYGFFLVLDGANKAKLDFYLANMNITGMLALGYIVLNVFHKHPLLSFFALIHTTAFLYNVFFAIADEYSYTWMTMRLRILTIFVGLVYLALACFFRKNWNRKLAGFCFFVGGLAFLGAAFMLLYDARSIWQLFYLIIAFATGIFAVYVNTRIVFALSLIFFTFQLSVIISKYFSTSLFWPIFLMIFGLIAISVLHSVGKAIAKKT